HHLARVVESRYFAGYTEAATADILGVADRTVRRDSVKARAWLQHRLADSSAAAGGAFAATCPPPARPFQRASSPFICSSCAAPAAPRASSPSRARARAARAASRLPAAWSTRAWTRSSIAAKMWALP